MPGRSNDGLEVHMIKRICIQKLAVKPVFKSGAHNVASNAGVKNASVDIDACCRCSFGLVLAIAKKRRQSVK